MKTIDVIMVRIYMMESENLLNTTINYLQNEAKIRGISVFRAISGFGETGTHRTSLIDLSLNLPLVIEFFDNEDKTKLVLEHLATTIKHKHIVFWEAKINE
ncbi:MAG: DUF190 domain-containing protein [Gammaproteobacteria bacterium]